LRFVSCCKPIVLAAFLAASVSAHAQRVGDPLAPIVRCIGTGKFAVLQQGRLPASVTSRSVETPTGNKTVTLADGYRVILATSQGEAFVNLKVELSSTAEAAADRAAVEEQMKLFSSRRGPGPKDFQRTAHGGVEVLELHQPNLEDGGPVSFYSIFVPSKAIIATLYVLNQKPDKRAFSTYGEYEALRDQAVKLIQGCAATAGV
jgi:hypothetical protein